jgi:hypothetical protein
MAKVRRVVRVTLAGAAIGIILTQISPTAIIETIARTEPLALGTLLLGSGVGILIQWRKWLRLLEEARPSTTTREGLSSLFAGFGFGLVTPGRLGELGRGSLLSGQRSASAGAAVADRLCSSGATVLAGLGGLAYLDPSLGLLPLTMGGVGMVVLFRHLGRSQIDPGRAPVSWLGETVSRIVFDVAATIQALPASLWASTMAWSILFNLVFFSQFIIVAAGWLSFTARLVAATPLIFAMKTLVPIGFLDLGAREGAAVLTFTWLGLDPVVGLSAALLVYTANVLVPGVIGWMVILRKISAQRDDTAQPVEGGDAVPESATRAT